MIINYSMDIWVGFIFLIITNNAAMNICVQVLEWMLLFGKYPGVDCLDHMVDACLSF